jgi:hypothetical protein
MNGMSRQGPLLTLGSVVIVAGLFLYGNAVAKPGGTPAAVSTPTPTPTATATSLPAGATSAPAHALFAGRSSGDQVTVAIAINGKKAAADLNAGLASQVSLQGSVSGSLVTLTSSSGTRLTGSVSGPDMFGTVSGFLGQSFPFSAAQDAVQAVYAGRSSNGELTLAVSTDGDQAVAYVCNGHTIEAWLQGSVKGNQVNLTGNKGANLTGSLSGLALFGTVTPDTGLSLPFSAELSPHPAGVFQARIAINGLATRIGWAVLPDGAQVGVAVIGSARQPAPPLDLIDGAFTLDGSSFTAAQVAGNATVVSP